MHCKVQYCNNDWQITHDLGRPCYWFYYVWSLCWLIFLFFLFLFLKFVYYIFLNFCLIVFCILPPISLSSSISLCPSFFHILVKSHRRVQKFAYHRQEMYNLVSVEFLHVQYTFILMNVMHRPDECEKRLNGGAGRNLLKSQS